MWRGRNWPASGALVSDQQLRRSFLQIIRVVKRQFISSAGAWRRMWGCVHHLYARNDAGALMQVPDAGEKVE